MRETQNQTKKNWSAQKASKLRFISRNCVKVRWVWCAARSVIWNLLSGAFFCRGQWDYLLWLYLPTWGVRSRASLGFKLQLCSIVGCGGTTKSSRNRCVLVLYFFTGASDVVAISRIITPDWFQLFVDRRSRKNPSEYTGFETCARNKNDSPMMNWLLYAPSPIKNYVRMGKKLDRNWQVFTHLGISHSKL